MGGYLAGRLRTKWTSIHSDEVYFRDTAHGFLAWSVALVVTAAFLASAGTSLMGSSISASERTGGSSGQRVSSYAYFIDMLFRSTNPEHDGNLASDRSEATVIFEASLKHGGLSPDDRSYLDQLVMARTSLSHDGADKRVSDVFSKTQEAADASRKILAHSLLWAFIALLTGAFCASFSATLGGRQRDHVVLI